VQHGQLGATNFRAVHSNSVPFPSPVSVHWQEVRLASSSHVEHQGHLPGGICKPLPPRHCAGDYLIFEKKTVDRSFVGFLSMLFMLI
jgi:hypothetical protein